MAGGSPGTGAADVHCLAVGVAGSAARPLSPAIDQFRRQSPVAAPSRMVGPDAPQLLARLCPRRAGRGWADRSGGRPEAAMLAVHLIATCSFLACAGLRFAALSQRVAEVPVTKLEPAAAAELPVYSVLVALHRETEMVPQLLVAL